MTPDNVKGLVLAAAVGGVAYIAWRGFGAVSDAVQNGAINPASSNNIANRAANAVVNATTGTEATIGGRIWEALNPGAVAAERAVTAPVTLRPAVQPPSSAALLYGSDLLRLRDMAAGLIPPDPPASTSTSGNDSSDVFANPALWGY